MALISRINQFGQQVRQEAQRITWLSRKDMLTTTAMVLLMVLICTVFLFLIDQIFAAIMRGILGV